MTAAILADTGPLYALADPSDQYHRRAIDDLESIARRGLAVMVSHGAVCEAYTLILRRLGGAYARGWLAQVLEGGTIINPEAGDLSLATAILDRFADHPITLVDALTAAASRRLAIPVWTFDRHFVTMSCKVFR